MVPAHILSLLKKESEPIDEFISRLKGECKKRSDHVWSQSFELRQLVEQEYEGDPFFQDFAECIVIRIDRPIHVPLEVLNSSELATMNILTDDKYTIIHGLIMTFEVLRKKNKIDIIDPTSLLMVNKSHELFLEVKESGNIMFKHKRYMNALKQYNRCVSYATAKDLSIAYFNRSAALFYIREHKLCLQDCILALESKYATPSKVHKRMTDCVQALKLGPVLTDGTDVRKNPLKYVKSIMKKLPDKLEPFDKNWLKFMKSVDEYGENHEYPALSLKCQDFCDKDDERTYGILTENVSAGDVVFEDEAFASVVNPKFFHDVCQTCLCEIRVAVPCVKCSTVSFCSVKCRDKAKFHTRECLLLPTMMTTQASFQMYLVLRIFTLHDLEDYVVQTLEFFYSDYVRSVARRVSIFDSELTPFLQDEYRTASPDGVAFEHVACARYLVTLLKKGGLINQPVGMDLRNFIPERLVGGLSLVEYHVYFTLCHIFSMVYATQGWSNSVPITKSLFSLEGEEAIIGVGRFLQSPLLQHSCDPDFTAVFLQDKMYCISRRPVMSFGKKKLLVSYGPMITKHHPNLREKLVQAQGLSRFSRNFDHFPIKEEELQLIYNVCAKGIRDKRVLYMDCDEIVESWLINWQLCTYCFESVPEGEAYCMKAPCHPLMKPIYGENGKEVRRLPFVTRLNALLDSVNRLLGVKPYEIDKLNEIVKATSVLRACVTDTRRQVYARFVLETKFDAGIRFLYALSERLLQK